MVRFHEEFDNCERTSRPTGRTTRTPELVGTILGEQYADRIDWVSTYQSLQVTADGHGRGVLNAPARKTYPRHTRRPWQ